jgi:ABC-2 type transport system permease protein
MSTVTAPVAAALHPNAMRQTWALIVRSIRGLIRQIHLLVPSLIFPLFFAALSSGSFNTATQLPGFPPVDSFLDFLLAGTIFQGVLFGSIQGATDLATDIEQGFFERLIASPIHRPSIILGRLGGAFVLGVTQALVFTIVFSIFGVTMKSGPLGYVFVVLSGGLVAVAFGGLLAIIAVLTGTQEAVQATFPLVFITLFFSSAFFPRETMSGWYKTIADWNPVSHIVEGMRTLVIGDLTASAVWWAVGVPLIVSVITIALAFAAMQRRLRRL